MGKQKDFMDLIIWSYRLGQHYSELKECEEILDKWLRIDKPENFGFEGDLRKDVAEVYDMIQFIVHNMEP